MNVLVSCDYQDGSAAGAGKSLVMCFGAIVAVVCTHFQSIPIYNLLIFCIVQQLYMHTEIP